MIRKEGKYVAYAKVSLFELLLQVICKPRCHNEACKWSFISPQCTAMDPITSMGAAHPVRDYAYSFCQIFQGLRLFKTLE